VSHDRDFSHPNELVITQDKNGDWYVAVVPQGQGTIGRGVRICTSGGAQMAVPGLGPAIAAAFCALATAHGNGITHK
jgi:hypothetical protein